MCFFFFLNKTTHQHSGLLRLLLLLFLFPFLRKPTEAYDEPSIVGLDALPCLDEFNDHQPVDQLDQGDETETKASSYQATSLREEPHLELKSRTDR